MRLLADKAMQTPLMVGFQRRFDPHYLALREQCDARRSNGEAASLFRLSSGTASRRRRGS